MKAMNSYLKKEVTLLGANSIFGRMTSFLLKQSPYLNKLTLFDDKKIEVSNDIRYINTPCNVTFVNGKNNISEALKSADIIIIGDECVNEISHESVFRSRAPVISNCVQQIACYNPNAYIVVATTPVNMTFPLVAETLKNLGIWNEKKLFGMTNVESMRAKCILANHLHISPRTIDFPVIGGSSSETRVPLLSRISPSIQLNKTNLQKIICAVKTSETKFHNASTNQESLNRAYATSMLIKSIVAALNGKEVVETVLSYQNVIKDTNYFSLPVVLGEEGIKKHISFPNISNHEKRLLSHAIKCMDADAKKAKYYSEKIQDNCIKIIPPNKLNKLKRHKHKNIKVKTPRLRTLPEVKRLNENMPLSKNFKSTEQIDQAGNKSALTLDEVNLTLLSKKSHDNSQEISTNTQNKYISSENKLPASLNEEIVSEIDVTLGISDIKSMLIKEKANTTEKQTLENITSNKSENNCSDLPNESTPSTESDSQKVNSSQSNIKEEGNDLPGKQSLIEPKEKTAQYDNSDKAFSKCLQKNKELVYPLSKSSAVNKLTEITPTTSISQTTNHAVNSGLENCKSFKRYHREVSDYRKNDGKDIENIDKNISLFQLRKEQMGSLSFETPHINQITVTTKNGTESKTDTKIYENKITVNATTKNTNNIKKYSSSEYLFFKNYKHHKVIPWKKDGRKDDDVLDLSKKFKEALESVINLSQREKILIKTFGTSNSSEKITKGSSKYKPDKTNAKNSRHLGLFQNSAADITKVVEIPSSHVKRTIKLWNISNDGNKAGTKNSLQINKPQLNLHCKLFKSDKYQSSKPPVIEWSRYASSESHDKQIDSNIINTDSNYNQQKQEGIHLNSQSDIDNKLEFPVSPKKYNSNPPPENTMINYNSRMPVKNINISQRINVFHQKMCPSTNKVSDNGFFESVLYKQKNVISSGLNHSSFINRISDQSCYVPQGKPKYCFKNSENCSSKRNQCELILKLHLLKNNCESSKLTSMSEQSSVEVNNTDWKKKYFASAKNNTIAKFSMPTKKVKDESIHKASKNFENKVQCHKEEKAEVQLNKERVEKNKCSDILNHNLSKDAVNNDERLSNRKKEIIISETFMDMQKRVMSDIREIKTEASSENIYEGYSCKSLTSAPCSSDYKDSCIDLGYLLHHPSMNSETNIENSQNTDDNKNEGCSLKIHDETVKDRDKCDLKNE